MYQTLQTSSESLLSVVRDRTGEIALHTQLDTVEIKVLECAEAAQVEQYHIGDDLGLGDDLGMFGGVAEQVFLLHKVIFLAELVDKKENFRNFNIDDHRWDF